MRKKIFIQILLSFLIILIFFIVYQKYFKKNYDLSGEKDRQEDFEKETGLLNIEYESIDNIGRKYIIKAESGIFDEKNPDLIYMTYVTAKIILVDKNIIYIKSAKAKYNTLDYDTKFEDNIRLKFLENDISCNNLNIFFKDNLLEAYNDLTYKNLDIIMLADKIELDLLTKNSKIFNFDEGKVHIKKRNLNGNN